MLQNQLHPPFFSLYCFFWILIVLFDRYGRETFGEIGIHQLLKSKSELPWAGVFLIYENSNLEDNSSFMFWRQGNK